MTNSTTRKTTSPTKNQTTWLRAAGAVGVCVGVGAAVAVGMAVVGLGVRAGFVVALGFAVDLAVAVDVAPVVLEPVSLAGLVGFPLVFVGDAWVGLVGTVGV